MHDQFLGEIDAEAASASSVRLDSSKAWVTGAPRPCADLSDAASRMASMRQSDGGIVVVTARYCQDLRALVLAA
jgi:hypothetical protein